MKKTLLLLSLIVWSQAYFAQCDTNRYLNPIFESVYKHADVKYGESPVWTIPYNNTDLFMDIYEPIGDASTKRPLMLWVHPGGFLTGDKGVDDMVALCDSFARRGYVTASVGYRLGFNPLSASSAERAVYRGTQDVRAAIRYMMEYADIYDIDTNYIFLGGSSAGGFATVHVAYGDQDEVPTSVYGGVFENDLGCLDCAGNNYEHDVNLAGIVNLWGALGDSTWVDADETVPALLIHGTDDGVVPFAEGHPFGAPTTPLTYGSRCIHNQLELHGIDHKFIVFEGQDHEPHGASNGSFSGTPTPYWDTIFNAVRDHYFEQLQPDSASILGETSVNVDDQKWYSVAIASTDSTCWTVQNGIVVEVLSDSIKIEWTSVGTGVIQARINNEVDAVSEMSTLSVAISDVSSVDELKQELSFVVYPNPTKKTIHVDELPLNAELIVSDGIGREVDRLKIAHSKVELDVQAYRSGVYFVTVIGENGKQTVRFIKE